MLGLNKVLLGLFVFLVLISVNDVESITISNSVAATDDRVFQCPDFDGDGFVGLDDWFMLIDRFGAEVDSQYDSDKQYDLFSDGVIDEKDNNCFANSFHNKKLKCTGIHICSEAQTDVCYNKEDGYSCKGGFCKDRECVPLFEDEECSLECGSKPGACYIEGTQPVNGDLYEGGFFVKIANLLGFGNRGNLCVDNKGCYCLDVVEVSECIDYRDFGDCILDPECSWDGSIQECIDKREPLAPIISGCDRHIEESLCEGDPKCTYDGGINRCIDLVSQIPSDCNPELMCGQAITCCDGLLYPTTCCSENCDEPIDECADCDPDLMCGEAETCCDGLLYPTTCCSENCDEPIGECGECIDGEINNDNPCNPWECWDGQWIEMIIDCGGPCGGCGVGELCGGDNDCVSNDCNEFGVCDPVEIDEFNENVELSIVEKTGGCVAGVCNFVLTVVGDSDTDGGGELVINLENTNYESKSYNALFYENDGSGDTPAGFAVRDITGASIRDITGNAVAGEPRSRFECGLRVNTETCCPVGYTSSADGSKCVLEPTRVCADFTGDGDINYEDFFILADSLGKHTGDVGYNVNVDLDSDGKIGFGDFFIFTDEFGLDPVGCDNFF